MTLQDFLTEWNSDSPTVSVHTSGSTGTPKIISVEKKRMEASANMTCDFLQLKSGDTALLCMPLDYIAGKMVVVRSIVRGLRLICVPPSSNPLASLNEPPVFAAMTPMQVYQSLKNERNMLKAVKHLIIGGGAIDNDIAEELKSFPNNVWSTYGMTETLSHVAMRRLSGKNADIWYTPLPGIKISIDADSCLMIEAPAVCPETLHTHDLAEINRDGCRFRVLGRKDNIINSGGIKIRIEDIEDLLRPHVHIPFTVTKVCDKCLGEAVTLLACGSKTDINIIRNICESVLPKYWRPRHYFSVSYIPLTGTGKPARAEAARIAEKALLAGI